MLVTKALPHDVALLAFVPRRQMSHHKRRESGGDDSSLTPPPETEIRGIF
jgi:hypothetical protein